MACSRRRRRKTIPEGPPPRWRRSALPRIGVAAKPHLQLPPPGNPLPRLDATLETPAPRNERRRGPTRTYTDRGRVLPPSYSPTWGDFALVPRFRDARLLGGTESLREEREDDKVNGPMQHRIGHECALCDAHSKAAERHTVRPHVRTQRYLPWLAPFALCVLLVPFVDGVARGLLGGIVVGLAAGAALSWLTTRVNRHIAATTLASATDELKAEADQRVAMVIRQFEWAVNDVANLRDALKRAQDSRATAEANELGVKRRQRHLERQLYEARMKIGEYSRALGSEDVAVDDEPTVLPTGDDLVVPSQIRIMNEHQSVIAISAHALDALKEGAQVSLVVRAPDHVVATLEGRHQGRFTFEALVDDAWCKVELKAAERPASKDKRARVWRPEDDRRPQSLIA